MTLHRALGIGLWIAVSGGAATACGGSVSGRESARDQLAAGGADRCEAACKTFVECGEGPTTSDDCSCGCPVGAAECPPCDCNTTPERPADCAAECGAQVDEVVEADAGCEDEMLAVLACVEGATACNIEERCATVQRTLEDCLDAGDELDDRPPVVSQPGNPGLPVTCGSGFGSAAGRAPGVPPDPVGTEVCTQGWEECSDGNTYAIRCFLQEAGALDCECVVNSGVVGSFNASTCSHETSAVNASCGWNL